MCKYTRICNAIDMIQMVIQFRLWPLLDEVATSAAFDVSSSFTILIAGLAALLDLVCMPESERVAWSPYNIR